MRTCGTHGVHPWRRLAGAVVPAALASWFATGIIARLDLPFLDDGPKYLLFALPLTWFMVAGACQGAGRHPPAFRPATPGHEPI